MRIHIVGAGLIGTSMGLGLSQKGHILSFEDKNSENLSVANDLLGGERRPMSEGVDLVVIATPAESVFTILKEQFQMYPQSRFIDIAGLKSELLLEVEGFPELAQRFCGTHPMAGRELSGPTAARAVLFEGASWILTPTSGCDAQLVEEISVLLEQLGAVVKVVDAQTHDRAIAAVSHLPQILSSLLARTLNQKNQTDLSLAGQGLRDLTRLADSNADLWSELLIRNSDNVKSGLREIRIAIDELLSAIESGDSGLIRNFMLEGNAGKSRIPGKHGGKSRDYAYLPIVIDDKPGQLAAIFDECSKVGANVEDLFIEHSPGQETGLITLALSQDQAEVLRSHLVKQNWRVHAIRAHR